MAIYNKNGLVNLNEKLIFKDALLKSPSIPIVDGSKYIKIQLLN